MGGRRWSVGRIMGTPKDELLSGKSFETLLEARVLPQRWRRQYIQFWPHSSLSYRPPGLT